MRKILDIVTNQGIFGDSDTPTGVWLGELTHFYDLLEAHGYEQDIASPAGGRSPLEPRFLGRLTADRAVRKRLDDPAFMARLEHTLPAEDLAWSDYDAIYFTDGHGTQPHHRPEPRLRPRSRRRRPRRPHRKGVTVSVGKYVGIGASHLGQCLVVNGGM